MVLQKVFKKIADLGRGDLRVGPYHLRWSVNKVNGRIMAPAAQGFKEGPYKLHIGPGPGWAKPGPEWVTMDADPERADVVIDLNDWEDLPFHNGSMTCIYGSHVFEHISVWYSQRLFDECYRILAPGGYFRLVMPDARKSLEEYLAGNRDFPLFKRRRERAKAHYGVEYTLFECMMEDFISRSLQSNLLGRAALAHQNAWDFETIVRCLCRAGFRKSDVQRTNFRVTQCPDFAFEGSYPSEANEDYRSMYVEARKAV